METDDIRSAAKKYLAQGFSPIPSEGKKPLVKWEEWQKRRPTEKEIDLWWETWPTANVGVITGSISGITVIDIDGEKGNESLRSFGIALPPTRIVQTPHGWHMWYQYDPSYPTKAGVLPGVDIRNEGGFIVAPPSSIGGAEYSVQIDVEIAKIPPFSELFKNGNGSGRKEMPKDPSWVVGLLKEGAPEHSRNAQATRLAGYLRNKNLGIEEAMEIMRVYAARCSPPMEDQELRTTLESVYRYAIDFASAKVADIPEVTEEGTAIIYSWPQYGAKIVLDQLSYETEGLYCEIEVMVDFPGFAPLHHGPVRFNLSATRTKAELARYLRNLFQFDWQRILDTVSRMEIYRQRTPGPTVDLRGPIEGDSNLWALSPFVLHKETTVLFGDGNSGKSMTALAILLSLQLQTDTFFGKKIPKKYRGLYLDWEASENSHKRRLHPLLRGHGLEAADPVEYLFMMRSIPDSLRQLKFRIDRDGIDFLVIDSAAIACGGEPEKAENAAKTFAALRSLGTTNLIIAHQPKYTEGVDKPFGSVMWHNLARSTVEVRSKKEWDSPNVTVGYYHRKSNYGYLERPFSLGFEFGNETTKISPASISSTPELTDKLSTKEKVVLFLRENSQGTAQEIAPAIDQHPETVRSVLKRSPATFQQIAGPINEATQWKLA